MPAYKTGKKTAQYSLDFKLKAVEWSYETHRTVKSIAVLLRLHNKVALVGGVRVTKESYEESSR